MEHPCDLSAAVDRPLVHLQLCGTLFKFATAFILFITVTKHTAFRTFIIPTLRAKFNELK